MNKIINPTEAFQISKKLREQGKKIVLAGGCFDILHIGHIHFIKESKKQGDILMLLLESDKAIRNKKGSERPINTQENRAIILAALEDVDFVVLIPELENDEYDDIIRTIVPVVIATTQGDKQKFHKERQAQLVQAKVVDVIPPVINASTTKIAQILSKEL